MPPVSPRCVGPIAEATQDLGGPVSAAHPKDCPDAVGKFHGALRSRLLGLSAHKVSTISAKAVVDRLVKRCNAKAGAGQAMR